MKRRHKDPHAISRVLNKLQPFTQSELLRLELPIRMSFQAIKTGTGTEQDFHDIAAAINTTIVRAESVGEPAVEVAVTASEAMIRAWKRYEVTGKIGLDGPAIGQIQDAITLHEEFCRNSTPLQMCEALKEVIRRSKEQAKHGN